MLEKKNQKKSKRNSSRRKVIKMRAEKSIKLKTKNQENKTNETESWSFEKISKNSQTFNQMDKGKKRRLNLLKSQITEIKVGTLCPTSQK